MKFSDIFKKKQDFIEFTESGFVQHKHNKFWGSKLIEVQWTNVSSINVFMWDCFSYHSFGFRLILAGGDSVCIDEFEPNWEKFRKRLLVAYPMIDESLVSKVDESLPDDQELCCWTNLAEQHTSPNH